MINLVIHFSVKTFTYCEEEEQGEEPGDERGPQRNSGEASLLSERQQ